MKQHTSPLPYAQALADYHRDTSDSPLALDPEWARDEWNAFVDGLVRDGLLTDHEAHTWRHAS